MKKKIAIIIHGGIGTGPFSQGVPMLYNIIRGLSDDFAVTVYSHSLPNREFIETKFKVWAPPHEIRTNWNRWRKLSAQVLADHRNDPIDVVMAFWGYPAGVIAVAIAKILNLRSVIYLQGGDAASIPEIAYGTFSKFVPRTLARWAYERTSRLIVMSKYQFDSVKKWGITNDIQIIPWGVDVDKFSFRLRDLNGILKIIHVGHFAPVKDQQTLILAFAEIAKEVPAQLRLFGADAGCRRELEVLCSRMNISDLVEFNEVVPYDDMPKHFNWADVMLHTSLSEGQCMALTEAAASGLLMAGTNVAPLYDLGERYGIIVNRGDSQTLARRVLELFRKKSEWQEKVLRSRVWIEQQPLQWTIAEIKKQLTFL